MSDPDLGPGELAAFQRNLPRFRRELGEAMGLGRPITQEELADMSGQKIDTLRSYEAGRRRPGLGAVLALARVFGRAVEDLIAKEPPPPDPEKQRAFAVRFKILGTPPPGLEEALQRVLKEYAEKAPPPKSRRK